MTSQLIYVGIISTQYTHAQLLGWCYSTHFIDGETEATVLETDLGLSLRLADSKAGVCPHDNLLKAHPPTGS